MEAFSKERYLYIYNNGMHSVWVYDRNAMPYICMLVSWFSVVAYESIIAWDCCVFSHDVRKTIDET